MVNRILLVFFGFDIAFLLCGGLLIAFPTFAHISRSKSPTLGSVAVDLLLDECPLSASTANAILVFLTFTLSLPTFLFRQNQRILQIFAALVVLCGIFTLVLGLTIWFSTLQTRTHVDAIWTRQSTFIKSMLQFKFQCCGYDATSTAVFVQDDTCSNAIVAARHQTCQAPFSSFANQFLDVVFTAFFGVCAVDAMLFLATLCVLKQRKELARYKFIDEKKVFGNI